MINIPDSVKAAYKSDSTYKSYFVVFRDSGKVLTNTEIVSESLQITESICSSGEFKVGLCESSVCSFEAKLEKSESNDEMYVFQCLGNFEPTWTEDPSFGLMLSGSGVSAVANGSSINTTTHLMVGDENSSFQANSNYLILARIKYIYKEILLYLGGANGLTKNIYYIHPNIFNEKEASDWVDNEIYGFGDTVICDGSAWKSVAENNTDRPSSLSVKWTDVSRNIQIAIPIPGSVVSNYYCALYSDSTDISYGVTIYNLDVPIMPLGLYGIQNCKKKNGGNIYRVVGYGRMNDVGLSEKITYFYDASGTTVGSIVSDAAENTQVKLGSNLSVEGTDTSLVSITSQTVPNWPSNPIYEKTITKTITGTYNRNGSGYIHTGSARLWTFNELKALGNAVKWKYQYYGYYESVGTYFNYYPEMKNNIFNPDGWDGYKFYLYRVVDSSPGDTVTSQQIENWYNQWMNSEYIPENGCLPGFLKGLTPGYNIWHPDTSRWTFSFTTPCFSFTEKYTYGYTWDTSQVKGWKLVSETETSEGNCTRTYSLKYTWNAFVTSKSLKYQITDYQAGSNNIYEVDYKQPRNYGAYPDELTVYDSARQLIGGSFSINKHSAIQSAIDDYSTSGVLSISNNGEFDIAYIDTLRIVKTTVGDTTTTVTELNKIYNTPFVNTLLHTSSERFSLMHIDFSKTNDFSCSRRDVISSYLELNGLFINFDRYGISELKTVAGSMLYPAENLYPRDESLNPTYENIYPSESGETLASSICKSLLVEDGQNKDYDGIQIIKSDMSGSDASMYPFYYNRRRPLYDSGTTVTAETGYFEGMNYYVIKDNIFFDNFVFTEAQLKEICKEIITRIGNFRYYNMEAVIRALPYLEVGDSINIMTPDTGYETLILRRTCSGCIAMMDTIETDFYN